LARCAVGTPSSRSANPTSRSSSDCRDRERVRRRASGLAARLGDRGAPAEPPRKDKRRRFRAGLGTPSALSQPENKKTGRLACTPTARARRRLRHPIRMPGVGRQRRPRQHSGCGRVGTSRVRSRRARTPGPSPSTRSARPRCQPSPPAQASRSQACQPSATLLAAGRGRPRFASGFRVG